MARALEGIRVLDLSHVLAGPTTTLHLADLGAEVIHIEPPQGDDAREFGPFVGPTDKNHSGYFISLNRNKKGMVLNLRHPRGKGLFQELLEVSDVVVENYRPGTLKKLGFDWEEMQGINPAIIYCSISGYGHDSLPEYRKRPSYDIIAQAFSGIMSITGPEGGKPCRIGNSMGDIIAGTHAVVGILAALIHRGRTGRGQCVDISMVDSLFSTLENAIVRYTALGEIAGPLGDKHPTITPFQGYETKDSWIVAAIGTDNLFANLCNAMQLPSLSEYECFKTNPLRTQNRNALNATLGPVFKEKSTAEWCQILDKAGIPYSPINNLEQICNDAHIQSRNMLVEIDQPMVGKMRIANSAIHLSETPGEVYAPAPILGQHSEEILTEILGYRQHAVEQLKQEGIINDCRIPLSEAADF
ncbi:MAG: CoA transferase [Syntrophobacter sp.]